MTTANNNIAALTTRVSTNEADIATNASDIAVLKNRVTATEDNITALQNSVSDITDDITALYNKDTDLQTQIDNLGSTVSTMQTTINGMLTHDADQDRKLSDLDARVTALEQGGPVPQSGPFIGDLVHVRDSTGHCEPAICYEDWDGKNGVGIISVVILTPVRISTSEWFSGIEVKPAGLNDLPFTAWHWPERAFQARMNLFARLSHG